MHCKIVLKHGRVNVEVVKKELGKIFGQRSLRRNLFHTGSEVFRGYPEIEKNIIYLNKLPGTVYAFLRLDLEHTQVWAECTAGRETFSRLESIVDNGLRAIKESQGRPKKCQIESGYIYEQTDTDSLELAIEETSWTAEIRRNLSLSNFLFLLFTWVVAVVVTFSLSPAEERDAILLVQPSIYAPAGAVLITIAMFVYNKLFGVKRKVRIRVTNKA